MLLIAADPGLAGGLAAIGIKGTYGREEETVDVLPMPVKPHFSGKGKEIDVDALLTFVEKVRRAVNGYEPLYLIIERVNSMPSSHGGKTVKMGTVSAFSFGNGFGILRGALSAYARTTGGVTWDFPFPQAWAKVVFSGTKRVKGDSKKCALSFVTRRYPGVSLLASKRCSVPHSGIVDSLAIVEYGRRKYAPGN